MANLVMAFGPKERFFVQSATAWKDNDLPARLQKYFENPTTDAVSHVYNIALGSKGSFFIAYRKKNGLHSRSRAELPANLSEWVFSEERDVPNMYVTLGPDNKSYWASDGMSYICSNLPSGLDAEIEKLRKPEGGFMYQPRIVALGIDGTYVMANSGNGGCWDLKNHYPALDMELDRFKAETLGKGGMFQPIESVYLNPHHGAHYVLVTKNGGFLGAVHDDHVTAFNTVLETIPKRQISAAKPVAETAIPIATPISTSFVPRSTVQMARADYNPSNSTFPAPRLLPRNREANTGSRTNGLIGALVTGVVKGTISGLTGTQPSFGNQFSFGGGGGFGQIDYSGANMGFQGGLQQNFAGDMIG